MPALTSVAVSFWPYGHFTGPSAPPTASASIGALGDDRGGRHGVGVRRIDRTGGTHDGADRDYDTSVWARMCKRCGAERGPVPWPRGLAGGFDAAVQESLQTPRSSPPTLPWPTSGRKRVPSRSR